GVVVGRAPAIDGAARVGPGGQLQRIEELNLVAAVEVHAAVRAVLFRRLRHARKRELEVELEDGQREVRVEVARAGENLQNARRVRPSWRLPGALAKARVVLEQREGSGRNGAEISASPHECLALRIAPA